MRRFLVITGVAVLIAAGWFAYRLGVGLDLWQPLRRPPEVPRQARYVVLDAISVVGLHGRPSLGGGSLQSLGRRGAPDSSRPLSP